MSNAWYSDSESPEELAAQLDEMRQQRAAMTEEQRAELAAFLIEGMGDDASPATPKATATPPAQTPPTPTPDSPPTSAAMHSTLKASADRGQANAPEDRGAWFAAKLREAAGA